MKILIKILRKSGSWPDLIDLSKYVANPILHHLNFADFHTINLLLYFTPLSINRCFCRALSYHRKNEYHFASSFLCLPFCMFADIAWNGNDEELLRKLSCFALFEDSLPLPSAIHLCWMEKGGGKKSNIKLLRVDFNGNFCLRKSNGTSCAKGECWRVGLRLDVFRKIVDTVWKWYFYEAMTLGMSKHENPSESSRLWTKRDRLLKGNKFITSFFCYRSSCLRALTFAPYVLREDVKHFRRYFALLRQFMAVGEAGRKVSGE